MIWLYRIFFLPGLLIALPYYLRRMIKRGGYRKDFWHRLGQLPPIPQKKQGVRRIWIQAVSVGEVKSIEPLITKLSQEPNTEIILTTTTSTGYQLAVDVYKNRVSCLGIFPLDFWPFSAKTWNNIQPDLAILMESELWPEHLYQANKRKIPIILINARLSERSFKRYSRAKILARSLLTRLNLIVASSELDANRFIKLGADPVKVSSIGNLKLDVELEKTLSAEELMTLKFSFGFTPNQQAPLILLGSSTWSGEEALLLKIYKKALSEHIDCRLLLVPRHAERRKEIEFLLKHSKLSYHFRSTKHQAPQGTQVYVADTTGELATLSQAADLAYIGKSLPPHAGGQTPIEAAVCGLPIVYGPNMSNFRYITRSLESDAAALRCKDAEQVSSTLLNLLKDATQRHHLGQNARAWHASNKGATERTLQALEPFLKTA